VATVTDPATRSTAPAAAGATGRAGLRVTTTRRTALAGDEPVVVDGEATGIDRQAPRAFVGAIGRSEGRLIVEVVVGGWRFELAVEPERRAQLRDRGTRSVSGSAAGGPVELRAIIPGRVASVAVAAGERVDAGQELLVIEAMKMQNELRAPVRGVVTRVGVVAGETIELGDLLVVLGPDPQLPGGSS
jgi:biotin carboxyl carrier protein